MCGFVKISNRNGHGVKPIILKILANAILHQGPDEEGMFSNLNCGFYHKRLSITDLRIGQQSKTFLDYRIVFNGEIYNCIDIQKNKFLKIIKLPQAKESKLYYK